MVQFIQTQSHPTMRLAETLGQSLGKGLGEFALDYYSNRAIDNVMNDPSLKKADQSERMGALERALAPFGQAGNEIFQRRMQIEEKSNAQKLQKEKLEIDRLKVASRLGNFTGSESAEEMQEKFGDLLTPQELKMWGNLSTGGKTSVINNALDRQNRETPHGGGKDLGEDPLTGEEWPVPAFPEGTTPKDRAGIIKDRAKLNAPAYNELTTGIRSNEHAALRMKRLEQLNESGQLPEGVEN